MINKQRSSSKVPTILVIFQSTFNFLDRFLKNPQILNFIKIHPLGAKLFHVDRWADKQTDGQSNMRQLG
jgi:hypothetical protein